MNTHQQNPVQGMRYDESHSDTRILIVDDVPANLRLLMSIMKACGYDVRSATSGEEALAAAFAEPPDLILLDVSMPQMSGYEVCEHLKSDDRMRDIPVLFISAYDEIDNKVKGFKVGGVDYITKPFQPDEITARVQSHLALSRQHAREQELVALKERQRIARDLHDSVSQTLFSASIMAEKLLLLNPDLDPEISQAIKRLYQLTSGALAEMRTLLSEMRPEALIHMDISELLTDLADMVVGRTQAVVNLSAPGPIMLDPPVQIAFYRIAQEALNNIVKHAQADTVDIELTTDGYGARLVICDNGAGFITESVPPKHYGLIGMRERAEDIGAILEIETVPGTGTCIKLEWLPDGA